MKRFILKSLPWIITAVALYFAFRGIEWSELARYLWAADIGWLFVAFCTTSVSYLLRARRWQVLFPEPRLNFWDSARVLVLGFFMNNVLPARTGELVRAHIGAKIARETRTHVLATIVSERLADGLTISFMFVIFFAFHLNESPDLINLFYVACLFGAAGVGAIVVLALRTPLFRVVETLAQRFSGKKSVDYAVHRIQVFVNGLSPLYTLSRLPRIAIWSAAIWIVELFVYVLVARAFGADLSVPHCVLFMVAVNFSSLIPAAPGGIGVIEAVATAVLVSVGIAKELALPMVIAQHAIQILVVGIPGAIIMATWNKEIRSIPDDEPAT